MARVFITGSADGLGQLAAKELIKLGHQVVLHARSKERAKQTWGKVPDAQDVLVADISNMDETRALASKANALGTFDAVIHNAGVYQIPKNSISADSLPILFAVNSLAPYILTCLMHKPKRFIYLSSGMHLQGDPNIDKLPNGTHNKRSEVTYSDTKLHNLILSMVIAQKWKDVYANAVDPGWVPTKMGSASAPDDLEKGYETQVWLAVNNDADAMVSGQYFHHQKPVHYSSAAKDAAVQNKFIALCEQITGISLNKDK